jgi:integrase/recombinase XerD
LRRKTLQVKISTMADRLNYASLITSWTVHLRAERKSPSTIESYVAGAQGFLRFCEREGLEPNLDRRTVSAYVAGLLDEGAAATTARQRQLAVRRFSAWLVEEDELDDDRLLGLKPVKLDVQAVEPLTADEIRAMLKACNGKRFGDLRDAAMLRLLFEGAMRIGELLALDLDDVDLTNGSALIRRGKGGRGRPVPFGAQTARAIDRWLRVRKSHRLADECPALWLAERRDRLGYHGARKTLLARAEAAGVQSFHPHLSRHTAATRWLAAGGSEGGLMAVAGWSNRSMIDRYTAHSKSQRAAEEARKLNLGDL